MKKSEQPLLVRGEEHIVNALAEKRVSKREARQFYRKLLKLEKSSQNAITPAVIRGLLKSQPVGLSANSVIELATLPISPAILICAIAATMENLHRALHPRLTYDEWQEFHRVLQRRGWNTLSEPVDITHLNEVRGRCQFQLICNVTLRVFKSHTNSPRQNGRRTLSQTSFGATVYAGVDVNRGTVTSVNNEINCFVTIVIKLEIHINQKKIGKGWTEQNRNLLRDRRRAQKQTNFDKVPFEFVEMHEEEHVREVCPSMAAIAQRYIRCEEFDEAAMSTELQQWWDRSTAEAANIQSATEERIRRRVWERWDNR